MLEIILKILQARLQQYVNWELPDIQVVFSKDRETRDQIANICWIIEKAREFQKDVCFCFIDYTKAFDCVDHNKLWEILQEMGIPDHLTCLWRNLCTGEETVDTGPGTLAQNWEWSRQGGMLPPRWFNSHAECSMWNTSRDEAQAGVKIAGRNIHNLTR